MENKATVVKPIHIAFGVGAIIIAMIVVPMASTAYNRAYPEYGTGERLKVDECAEKEGESIRWRPEALAQCKAVNYLRRRF